MTRGGGGGPCAGLTCRACASGFNASARSGLGRDTTHSSGLHRLQSHFVVFNTWPAIPLIGGIASVFVCSHLVLKTPDHGTPGIVPGSSAYGAGYVPSNCSQTTELAYADATPTLVLPVPQRTTQRSVSGPRERGMRQVPSRHRRYLGRLKRGSGE